MELLRLVTLVYAGVLVLALAASLIAILYYLWRIGTVLRHVGVVLGEARERTRPLPGLLEPLGSLPKAEADAFLDAVQRFEQVAGEVTERLHPSARAGAA